MNYLKTFLPYLFGNKKGKSLDIPLPQDIPWSDLHFEELLMFHTFKNSLNQYVLTLDLNNLSKKDMFHLFNFLDHIEHDLKTKIYSTFPEDYKFYQDTLKSNPLKAFVLQELLDFKNQKLSVFAILRADRSKPGVLLVRSANGEFLKKENLDIWSIPILGLSGRGLPFNHSNGCTPTGVFTLDSVMPLADKKMIFGEFRRLIVNFIKMSPDELELKKLIPSTHYKLNWWKPSAVGRDLGRSLLRIHGTGRKNLNPMTSHFPFVPTSGCLATNESSFFGLKKVQDQRLLLDALMRASDIPVSEENESKIHGLLYVVELDDNLAALRFN